MINPASLIKSIALPLLSAGALGPLGMLVSAGATAVGELAGQKPSAENNKMNFGDSLKDASSPQSGIVF